MRKYILTRYPKCRQTFTFDLPKSITNPIDIYNYFEVRENG